MKKRLILTLLTLVCLIPAMRAQVVTTEPNPLQEDSENVVVFFHADEGNKGLMGLDQSTHIYAHTGVNVINANGTVEEWKYAPKWEEDLPKYQLEYVSPNLWKLNIGDIREFYGVDPTETVTQLCFVFRNTGGTKEGKDENGSDIFVDVLSSGFQLTLTTTGKTILKNDSWVRFTAATTQEADIKLYLDDELNKEASGVKSLQSLMKISGYGNHEVKAVATVDDKSVTRTIPLMVVGPAEPSELTEIPPMGLTRNSDNTYTFCLAAPGKESVVVVGSWNNYLPSTQGVTKYIDRMIDGNPFRYFTVTIPASVTGDKFSYYYAVDGIYSVGDPYALLVLDPSNDKYISEEVYPDMPQYPTGLVPNNTVLAYYSKDLLDYDWQNEYTDYPANDNLVIYELLFRDFTGTEGQARGNGTVRKALEKLPYLKDLGVNAIELLPINEFNGNNSWGYNPNFYFAIDKAYGTPQDYKEFIDKCHENGIAVILDVVFNQSDWLHPWYAMYKTGESPFYNATAPHAYSVLNDWNQGYPLVEEQWKDMLKFWLKEYKVDGFRFDLVKGLGDNTSYANSFDSATNAFNQSRVDRMKRLHDAMREVNPKAYFINENLAGAREENLMAEDGELNWANVNNAGCQYAMGYMSDASLSRMWAKYDGRKIGSTIAYLESHDEQRLAYKQTQWGVAQVKGDHKVAMQRCGAAAAQMILSPGSHMIWMFSELGNAQNTKDNTGGNNTSPKIVNWNLYNDPDNRALMMNYKRMIDLRLGSPELFADGADYTASLSGWSNGRWIKAVAGDKELYFVANPDVTKQITVPTQFKSNLNSDYTIYTKANESNPSFDASAKTVTLEPSTFVVIVTNNIMSGVEDIIAEENGAAAIYSGAGVINVLNVAGGVEVYGIDGALVESAEVNGNATISVPAGIYVVRAGDKTAKVIVR